MLKKALNFNNLAINMAGFSPQIRVLLRKG